MSKHKTEVRIVLLEVGLLPRIDKLLLVRN